MVQIETVTKTYRLQKSPAVNNVSMTVESGEIVALGGLSGSGKTTLLRIVAGFEHPDSGRIVIHGRAVVGPNTFVTPEQRGVGMVFQDRALFPHLTVSENVAFGLSGRKKERSDRVQEMLHLTDIGNLGNRYPHELSGGQQQRVALARALAPKPAVVLLDEPFTNLDGTCTHRLLRETRRILHAAETTAIVVTHSRYEAFSVADRIGILHDGRLEQLGTPPELFHRPHTKTVAEFGGTANFIPVDGEAGAESLLGPLSGRYPLVVDPETEKTCAVVRPAEMALDLADSPGEHNARARVVSTRYLGDRQETVVQLNAGGLECVIHSEPSGWTAGSEVVVRLRTDQETGSGTSAAAEVPARERAE